MDLRNISFGIELPLLLTFFAIMITDPVNTNFIIYRTCYVTLGHNETECAKLGSKHQSNTTKELEKEVEPHANLILMTSLLISAIIPSFLGLFIGPWSDKHGRRVILLISVIGSICNYLAMAVLTAVPMASPWFLLLTCVPIILSGGFPTFLMITICYVTDISTVENRGMRMAIFEALIALGMLLGTFSSSYILAATNYTIVPVIGASVEAFVLAFTYFFVKESVVNISEISDGSGVFSSKHIKDMFRTTLKRRENNNRRILLILISMLMLYIFAVNNGNLMFMYLRSKFGWSLEKFTLYSSAHDVVWIVGTFIGVYVLHKLWSMSEISLLLLGFVTMVVSTILQGTAVTEMDIYISAVIRCLGGVISPMVRSLISKIVSSEDIGKVFSLTIALESLAGILSSPIYTLIYNSTLTTYQGAFCLFGTGLYGIEVLLTLTVMFMKRFQSSSGYNVLVPDSG